jgi:hypothetical protein
MNNDTTITTVRKMQVSALKDLDNGHIDDAFDAYDRIALADQATMVIDQVSLLKFWNKINSIDGLDVEQAKRLKMFANQWVEILSEADADDIDTATDGRESDVHDQEDFPGVTIDYRSIPVSELNGKDARATFKGWKMEDHGVIDGRIALNNDDVVLLIDPDSSSSDYVPIGSIMPSGYLKQHPKLQQLYVYEQHPSDFQYGDSSEAQARVIAQQEADDYTSPPLPLEDHSPDDQPIMDPRALADAIENMVSDNDQDDDQTPIADRAKKFLERYAGFNDLPLHDDAYGLPYDDHKNTTTNHDDQSESQTEPSESVHDIIEDDQTDHPINSGLNEDDLLEILRSENEELKRQLHHQPEDIWFMANQSRGGRHDYTMFKQLADADQSTLVILSNDHDLDVKVDDDQHIVIPSWMIDALSGHAMIVVDGITVDTPSTRKTLLTDRVLSIGHRSLRLDPATRLFVTAQAQDLSALEQQLVGDNHD